MRSGGEYRPLKDFRMNILRRIFLFGLKPTIYCRVFRGNRYGFHYFRGTRPKLGLFRNQFARKKQRDTKREVLN